MTAFQDTAVKFEQVQDVNSGVIEIRYAPIPVSHNLAIIITILILGLFINITIFYCYFRQKSDLARYIRVFAILDCFMIVIRVLSGFAIIFFPQNKLLFDITYYALTALMVSLVLGTLFLSLDRFIAITYPLKFLQYNQKLRMIKIILAVDTVAYYTCFTIGRVLGIQILITITSFNFIAILLANIVLYITIVVKIRGVPWGGDLREK